MFPVSYFTPRYFAPTYFPEVGGEPAPGIYFAPGYFAPTYFAPLYFPGTQAPLELGIYFAPTYFCSGYFAPTYFPGIPGNPYNPLPTPIYRPTGRSQLVLIFNKDIHNTYSPDLGVPTGGIANVVYLYGTRARQINFLFARQLLLPAAPVALDLSNLVGFLDLPVGFARVREMWVLNQSSQRGAVVTLSGGLFNPWSGFAGPGGAITLNPGATFYRNDPASTDSLTGMVVSNTSRSLVLDPGSCTITVSIFLAGGNAP